MTTPNKPAGRSRPSLNAMRRPKPSAVDAADAPPADDITAREETNGRRRQAPKGNKDDLKGYLVRFDRDLMTLLKLAAINEERPASEIVRDALRSYLKGTGGMRPVKMP